jgi:hypothetical protein
MMAQGLLPFQYLRDKIEKNLTSFAGLPLYLDLIHVSGLRTAIDQQLQSKTQGWRDLHIISSLILLNLVGGDCVDDIERLEQDEGLATLCLSIETFGMKRRERRAYEKGWRKEKTRAFPSTSTIHRYLEQFHHAKEEKKRVEGTAFIPAPNDLLQNLLSLNTTLIQFAQRQRGLQTATLDQDATLAETHKRSALYSYKNFKAYQPLNTYWYEQGLLIHSEFRDGNVPAGYEQLRVLQEVLQQLPEGVVKVLLRSDSAGYQEDILEYCAEGQNERFGVIEFAIAARVSESFKQSVLQVPEEKWHTIYREAPSGEQFETGQEWAEVCFVPRWAAHSKKNPHYRYLAIRERMAVQTELPGMEPVQQELPFQTLDMKQGQYKLFGIVTNRALDGNALIHWHRQRCGDSEKVHHVEKSELAGGQFPSQKFGANAAWWQIMVMTFNLHQMMKQHALPESLKTKGLKALRFQVIAVAGRVIHHGKRLFIKLSGGEAMAEKIYQIRERIATLVHAPPSVLSTA